MTMSRSNPPAENTGTVVPRFNALRHGVLSRYTVLPWEDAEEYAELLAALAAEHDPKGATEEHLVEELAGILWRKRRLRLAEAAVQRRGLDATFEGWRKTVRMALVHLGPAERIERVADAIQATPEDTQELLRDVLADEAMTREALALLVANRPDAYQAALSALRDDTRQWWADLLKTPVSDLDDDDAPATPDRDGLHRFLESKVMPWFATRKAELANRPLIREQAFGEAVDTDRLDKLARYEVHLDRKLERMLAMLLKLKEMRFDSVRR